MAVNEVLAQQIVAGQKLGGTDGFRGIYTDEAGSGLMNAETIAGLTFAAIAHQRDKLPEAERRIVVGQDTRSHGQRLRLAVIAAAQAHDAEVIDLGIAPTPTAQKIGSQLGALATFVVSASHNSAKYNGLKYMPGWQKPSADQVCAISNRYWAQQASGLTIPSVPYKELSIRHEPLRNYEDAVVAEIRRQFDNDAPLAGKLFVIDGANGAARYVTQSVFKRLGARTEAFACDGGLINDGTGAAHLEGVKDFLAKRPELTSDPNFVGAIANDGDGDRVMAVGINVDGNPVEINGNHMLWTLATDPRQVGVVGTEYTNSALVARLQEPNVNVAFEYCPNGDVYVTQALESKQARGEPWTRGAEPAGHVVDTTWLSSGDGVYQAARLAAWATQHDRTFAAIDHLLPLWEESKLWVDFPSSCREGIQTNSDVQAALQQLKVLDGPSRRFIIRASGTEPGVRVWGESPDAEFIHEAVSKLGCLVRRVASEHSN